MEQFCLVKCSFRMRGRSVQVPVFTCSSTCSWVWFCWEKEREELRKKSVKSTFCSVSGYKIKPKSRALLRCLSHDELLSCRLGMLESLRSFVSV